MVAGGGTALYAGVAQGASELREFLDPHRVNRIILLSDGQANKGPSSPSELGNLGAALISEGISVTTIGIGLGYNEDLMTQLAPRSDAPAFTPQRRRASRSLQQRERAPKRQGFLLLTTASSRTCARYLQAPRTAG